MTDELFMRQWNRGHAGFSADVDRKLALLSRYLTRRERRLFGIRETYDNEEPESSARAILSGLAASLATTTLFLGVGLLATLGQGDAAQAAPFLAVATLA